MIAATDVIPILLEASPSFSERWSAYVADAAFDGSLLYVHLGEFAFHLVELAKRESMGEFGAVFDAVERLHVEGDSSVKAAATIGLLEGLQNVARNRGLDPETFVPYLRPESSKWWAELNAFWAGQIPYVGAGLRRGN